MKSNLIIVVFTFLMSFTISKTQNSISFINKTSQLDNSDIGGPFCRAFADINGDYRDDIIRLNKDNQLYYDLNSDNGSKFYGKKISNLTTDAWTITVADINNDGINDILTAGISNPLTIWSRSEKNSDFILSQEIFDLKFFAQSSNLVDINNDGWLDAFICNDEGLNKIYINNGQGLLEEDNTIIDFHTAVPSDNSGNYGSEWTDVDGDGDLDLYIAKCRINVNDFDDPRRINALYINHGDHFTEEAKDFGIDVGAQSWTENFADIDNDGDMDLFLVNHYFRCMLFENINNTGFVEINLFPDGSELNVGGYQSAFCDFNNDGYQDILIAGEADFILYNNGNKSFTKSNDPFGTKDIASFSLADADHNGFIDVLGSYNIFSFSNFQSDSLWVNSGNQNNFINISLKGIESNTSGIGAKVSLYGSSGKQIRIIKSGTGYGVTNSLSAHFGIGQSSSIDSLVINWPSGVEDVYYEPQVNNHYLAVENSCMDILPNISSDSDILDCLNDQAIISSNNDLDLLWQDGTINNNFITSQSGIFSAINPISSNCQLSSQTIVIDELSKPVKAVLNISDTVRICDSLYLNLELRNLNTALWSTEEVGSSITAVSEGRYYAANFNHCDTVISDPFVLEYIDKNNSGQNEFIEILTSQELQLESNNTDPIWYRDESRQDILYQGNIFNTGLIEEDTVFYVDHKLNQQPPVILTGEPIAAIEGNEDLIFETAALSINFEVFKTTVLRSVMVNALMAGERLIFIVDENFNRIYEQTIFIDVGISRIEMDAFLVPGKYSILTDGGVNNANFGIPAPQLSVAEVQKTYPYLVSDILQIEGSLIGQSHFPYFFDWEIEMILDECRSDVYEYIIDVKELSTQELQPDFLVTHSPNPFDELITITSNIQISIYEIYDLAGNKIKSAKVDNKTFTIPFPKEPSGIYYLRLKSKDDFYNTLLLKN